MNWTYLYAACTPICNPLRASKHASPKQITFGVFDLLSRSHPDLILAAVGPDVGLQHEVVLFTKLSDEPALL